MSEISIKTNKHDEFINITSHVQHVIPKSFTGLCHVFCKHTTAGLTINENADSDVTRDIQFTLDKLIPWDNIFYRHVEGNSSAHVKALITGSFLMVPVRDGKLELGVWQGIYFCEFDGPRSRRVTVTMIPSQE